MTDTSVLAQRLTAVRTRVAEAARTAGRRPDEIRVLLATKTLDAETVRAALTLPEAAGMVRGENRVQELVAKGPALADLAVPTHLIGPLQSNKVNAALRWAGCVQSVTSVELATRLSDRVADGAVLDVMVQVNVSGEVTKHGVAPEQGLDLAAQVAALPRLRLIGFMTVGAHTPDTGLVRAGYARLAAIRDEALAAGLATARELSMGMSGDLELAVAEGATMVRVGTAVFGARPAL
ncbi:YggS family pyridoxal phosphate-dependent enzyme [Cellulomonas citrea]|uniref:YggS family pyridoxal phosphate-dependent enzyme n=1 Tax=Cellulomonas citrea TaxID=1909423 RepID=UPI001F24AD55|nr:YggS family pyridoxal phosphate-dependent enzyme [Cellulomonas citrea]